jgi:excisionase family DNA binding protein
MSGGALLTTREVAERLGVSPETVLRWIEMHGLPARRLTSRDAIRYDESDLDAWLEARATAAPVREAPATLTDAAARRLSSHAPAIPPQPIAASTEEGF